jgi:hypothetical protein
MATKKVTELPERVTLNLDSLERETKADPFSIAFGGRRIEFADVQEIDYRILMTFESDPLAFFSHAIKAEDKEHFDAQPLPGWKLEALIRAYRDHYGLGAPGNAPGSGI